MYLITHSTKKDERDRMTDQEILEAYSLSEQVCNMVKQKEKSFDLNITMEGETLYTLHFYRMKSK